MPGNVDPIYTRIGDVSANGTTGMPVHVITATGDYTGVSANHALVHTAGSERLIRATHSLQCGRNEHGERAADLSE